MQVDLIIQAISDVNRADAKPQKDADQQQYDAAIRGDSAKGLTGIDMVSRGFSKGCTECLTKLLTPVLVQGLGLIDAVAGLAASPKQEV